MTKENKKSEFLVEIVHDNKLLAIILRTQFNKNGIEFFTPNDFSQQLGYMKRDAGYIIDPHVHNPVTREVDYTKEVLFVKSGKLRVDFYDEKEKYLFSKKLYANDLIMLSSGGHGFKVLKDIEMIEVKQGPYFISKDKVKFDKANESQIKIK